MVWLTQLLFYGLPWLSWNDRQAVLFDLDARRFYLFKLALYPQDFQPSIFLFLLFVLYQPLLMRVVIKRFFYSA